MRDPREQLSPGRRRIGVGALVLGGASVAAAVVLALSAAPEASAQERPKRVPVSAQADDPAVRVERGDRAERVALDRATAGWPARTRLAARLVAWKHGPPDHVTSEVLVWDDVGPFLHVEVRRREVPHDFPRPHHDYLTHVIAMDVPADRVDDLAAFDGSLVVDRTVGKLSVTGDSESHNLLVLNLAHEVIRGEKSAATARRALTEATLHEIAGKRVPHLEKLAFAPAQQPGGFTDKPSLPGAPVRGRGDGGASDEAQVLGYLVAIHDGEIMAAQIALAHERLGPALRAYAEKMHMEHGRSLLDALVVGRKVNAAPAETKAVDELRERNAATLYGYAGLEGKAFEVAFLDAMIQDHTEALRLIDDLLTPRATSKPLRDHLVATRAHVQAHLDEARKLRAAHEGKEGR